MRKDVIRDFSATKNGDDNAKENSHPVFCSANSCINRARGSCLRTPPHANEGPRGTKRAIAEQQCLLCRTQLYLGSIVLVERRRRRDEFGARWSLICDVLRHCRVCLSEIKSGHVSDAIRRLFSRSLTYVTPTPNGDGLGSYGEAQCRNLLL
jgi:hypothetical protein